MNIRHLKTFTMAVKYANFTKAAEALHFAQPTVTAHIHALEETIGHPLFFRTGNKVHLTPAGHLLLEKTNKLFSVMEEMETAFSELDQPYGNITVAASEFYCTRYFPAILGEYTTAFPQVGIYLESCRSNEVIQGVQDGRFDVGIISGVVDSSQVTNILLEEEELLMVVSAALYEEHSTADLLQHQPFIEYQVEGSFKEEMNRFLLDIEMTSEKRLQFGSEEAMKQAILNNMGAGLVSANLVKEELQADTLKVLSIDAAPVKTKTSLIFLHNKKQHPSMEAFIELVVVNWEEYFTTI